MSCDEEITEKIATLNDLVRKRVMTPILRKAHPLGFCMITQGISALKGVQQIEIGALVRDYNNFNQDNDPYGWRDFGAFDFEGVGKIFWKIDIYADEHMRLGADAPHDPDQSFRLLTILLAEEY